MKITISELKKLINEEIVAAMKEGANDGPKTFFGDTENIFDEKQKQLSVPEKHQLAVAYKTLKMNPAMVGVMGGPSRKEAIETIKKLTGKTVSEEKLKSLSESMQRFCQIYKARDGNWYLELSPNEHDDRSTAFAYGPFSSQKSADEYLSNNFSNPGSMGIDDSGKAPVPKKSPNGRPLQVPKRGFLGFLGEIKFRCKNKIVKEEYSENPLYDTLEKKKQLLMVYKQQLSKLENKIKELEKNISIETKKSVKKHV